jgi:hypothetical protein
MEAALSGELVEDFLLVGVGAELSTSLARFQNSDMTVEVPSEGLVKEAHTSLRDQPG